MRMFGLIAGAGVLFANATFAQSQELHSAGQGAAGSTRVSAGCFTGPGRNNRRAPRSVTSCRNQRASYVPPPELTLA